jgi:ADP-heptose:LPS heptosyltransferase
MKVLLVRFDKIGDLIATLPVDQISALRTDKFKIHWVVSQAVEPVIRHAQPARSFSAIVPSAQNFRAVLKEQKPDAIVSFYAPWWVGFECWKAGIRHRVGRLSQWHSYLFFNRGLRQSRSLSQKHEADYNCELLVRGLDLQNEATPLLRLDISPSRHLLEKFQLQDKNFVVVHPGMAGSALNWPQTHFAELIEKLLLTTTVVITGTKADAQYLTELRPRFQHLAKVRWLENELSFEDLLRVLKMAKGLVAPSTGVLHLAASLGTPCVGIYSPELAHASKRWGARGDHVKILEPKSIHESMASVLVEDVYQSLGRLMGSN